MATNTEKYLQSLVYELVKLPNETEWVEFKCNYHEPKQIGEYISALSNSAALCEKPKGYMIWGINNETHAIEGTDFHYRKMKKGNEELESWLARLLNPRINFNFNEVNVDGNPVTVLEISCADKQPVHFDGQAFIRIGTNKKKLKDYPEKERELWRCFDTAIYELLPAMEDLTELQVTEYLDCQEYFALIDLPLPSNRKGIIEKMLGEKFILAMDNGNYAITNAGALLFARDLNNFQQLKWKAIRVIQYKDSGRTNAIREDVFYKGYAVAHEDLCRYIMSHIPQEEEITGTFRINHIMFPEIAIREMVGNLYIHQDLTLHGMSSMFEIFDTRVEATSPGSLLVDVDRIIDTSPQIRNKIMAAFLRRVNICEERGSGFDRMEEGMRDFKIPAPKVEHASNYVRTILFWYPNLNSWDKEDIVRTCYLATCYNYVKRIKVSNTVLRNRFGIEDKNMSVASRIARETVKAGKIKLVDEDAAPKLRRYIPYWA